MKRRKAHKCAKRPAKRSALVRLGGHLYRVELVERPKVTDAAGKPKRRRKGRR